MKIVDIVTKVILAILMLSLLLPIGNNEVYEKIVLVTVLVYVFFIKSWFEKKYKNN